MTGYTVHTGSSKKFAEGWDQIFPGKSDKSAAATKKTAGKPTAKKPAAKSPAPKKPAVTKKRPTRKPKP